MTARAPALGVRHRSIEARDQIPTALADEGAQQLGAIPSSANICSAASSSA